MESTFGAGAKAPGFTLHTRLPSDFSCIATESKLIWSRHQNIEPVGVQHFRESLCLLRVDLGVSARAFRHEFRQKLEKDFRFDREPSHVGQ